ncbi:unnamed protein product [Hydatigera taeniaeformis]|uniref:Uncharacterized protein n=1 Tax=Hydatigena taeniaeformis TaxID=6205 RepID=A0A0R3XAP4_HYDTA|nr:unnamed protein product [Hydatigera taeniaeformis]
MQLSAHTRTHSYLFCSAEGKHLAAVYSCDFYEVSISLNHQVNELLVGLVSAIKAANQHVNEERQRLSRIASLKGDACETTASTTTTTTTATAAATTAAAFASSSFSTSREHRASIKQKLQHSRRYSNMGKSIRHFFKKHFSLNGT